VDYLTKNGDILMNVLYTFLCEYKKDLSANDAIAFDQIYKCIDNNENNHYLAFANDFEKVTFAKCDEEIYDESKRTKLSLGKYIRRQLNFSDKAFSDTALSFLCNKVKELTFSPSDIEKKITLLSGKDITNFYKNDKYSCMSGDNSKNTQLYALNPDVVQLAVFNNKIRALLWTTDKGEKILDKIYPRNNGYDAVIKNWAYDKGYFVANNGYAFSPFLFNKEPVEKQFKFTLKHNNVFPYLDTFRYGKIKKDKVYLTNWHKKGLHVFSQQDGSASFTCKFCDKELFYTKVFSINLFGNRVCRHCIPFIILFLLFLILLIFFVSLTLFFTIKHFM
jgi:hypothetical protein